MIIDCFHRLVITQKSSTLLEFDQYSFDVDVSLKKPEIKAQIQDLYGVHVTSLHTHRLPAKKSRFGGTLPRKKRAIIRLKAGESLPIASS